jgi:hypothetical protein
MRHLLIIPTVLFALVISARAASVELPVTPSQLDQNNYKFTVSTAATNNGIAFHVIITAKQSEIFSDSEANLGVVTHPKDGKDTITGTSITPFQPTVPIAFNKAKRAWTADFTLPRESLKTPGLCFVFSELAHDTVNGQRVAMPSVTFYEIKLKEFVKE